MTMGEQENYRIVVIPGDGIGPSIVDVAVRVLDAVQEKLGTFRLDLEFHDAGAEHYQRTGSNLSPETFVAIQSADATIKGPVGLPDVRGSDGTEAGLLGGILRTGLDTFANVRPVTLLPGAAAPVRAEAGEIDYVIIRENTEGLYLSRGRAIGTDQAVADTMLITRKGTERVARYAFELARRRNGKRRVTCVDKSNVLGSLAFFRRVFDEVAERYPDIEAEHLYADAAAQALVLRPQQFDVLVMENFLGDILSDLGGATIGGIGLCASGNIGDRHAYFEPVHGSGPDIAGLDRANPIAQVLSAGLMLEHLGETLAAGMIRTAVMHALESRRIALNSFGQPQNGTLAAGEALVAAVREL
jgi:isocitrate/isopropylmalate dehydrogenase